MDKPHYKCSRCDVGINPGEEFHHEHTEGYLCEVCYVECMKSCFINGIVSDIVEKIISNELPYSECDSKQEAYEYVERRLNNISEKIVKLFSMYFMQR